MRVHGDAGASTRAWFAAVATPGSASSSPRAARVRPSESTIEHAFAVHVVVAVDQTLQRDVRHGGRIGQRGKLPIRVPRPVPRCGGPPDSAPAGRRAPRSPAATGRRARRELAGPCQVSSRKPKPRTVWSGSPVSLALICPMKKSNDLRPADHRGAPHLEHELLAADRLTLPGGQGGEDLELGLGERLRSSLQRDFSALAIDGDGSRDHRAGRGSGVAADAAHASHDGLNPRQQHRFSDRLDQVVVGAGAKTRAPPRRRCPGRS